MAVLADIIKQTRKELGISLNDLAARSGLCEADIRKFESDDPGWLRLGELSALLHVLGCRLDAYAVWTRVAEHPPAALKATSRPRHQPTESPPAWRTIQQIARRYQLSVRAIAYLMEAGSLPYYKVGHAVRFNGVECDNAMKAFRRASKFDSTEV